MINRAKMPRQLGNKGGSMNVASGTIGGGGYTGIPMGSRTGFGIIDKLKDKVRDLIPNEIANIAVKAAPFVAPFNPAIAGLMRGIGRFDQRGSLSDALKQGLGTYAAGQLFRTVGGGDTQLGFRGADNKIFTSPLSQERTQAIGSLFDKGEAAEKLAKDKSGILPKKVIEATTGKIPVVRALPKIVQEQLLAGTVTAGASLLASYFQGEFREQEPGETMEEYLAARKERVGQQMKSYMDNYYKYDPTYSALDDAGKAEFIARYNVAQGGRIGYQTGGISMANTLAENIRRNVANQAAFQQSIAPAQERARKKAFNVFMTPQGNVAKDQGIAQLARDTGKAPSITNLPITSGTDISRMIGPGTGIGEGKTSYSGGQT